MGLHGQYGVQFSDHGLTVWDYIQGASGCPDPVEGCWGWGVFHGSLIPARETGNRVLSNPGGYGRFLWGGRVAGDHFALGLLFCRRSEEHTSALQSLLRI